MKQYQGVVLRGPNFILKNQENLNIWLISTIFIQELNTYFLIKFLLTYFFILHLYCCFYFYRISIFIDVILYFDNVVFLNIN